MNRNYFLAPMLSMAFVLLFVTYANADTVNTYGDAVVVGSANGPAWQLTSNTSGIGWGGVYVAVNPGPLTPSSLTQLSASYQMVQGAFGGGAPRFTLFDTSFNGAYIYWGTPTGGGSFSDPLAGAFGSTGNYSDLLSPDVRVYSNGFGGLNTPNTGMTWAAFSAAVGSAPITYVFLDVDGGFTGTQQILVNNFQVNGTTYNPSAPVPEPATMFLLGSGLVGLGAKLRSRRKARKF